MYIIKSLYGEYKISITYTVDNDKYILAYLVVCDFPKGSEKDILGGWARGFSGDYTLDSEDEERLNKKIVSTLRIAAKRVKYLDDCRRSREKLVKRLKEKEKDTYVITEELKIIKGVEIEKEKEKITNPVLKMLIGLEELARCV